jgi:hypothetical protein
MKKIIIRLALGVVFLLPFGSNAQTIISEYFFDTDPGIGNGTWINTMNYSSGIEFDSAAVTMPITVPLTMLPGKHSITVRCGKQFSDGSIRWSCYQTRNLFVHPTSGDEIVYMEYFYDQDPGLGNGTSIALNSTLDSANFIGNLSTAGLNSGKHLVSVRSKNVRGDWSTYQTRSITVVNGVVSIDGLEYFFDQDPGCGQATPLTLSGNIDSSEFNGTLLSSSLEPGYHWLYTRVRNTKQAWSVYEKRKVFVKDNGNTILQAEYFVDQDPGIGFGTPLALNYQADSATFTGNLNTLSTTTDRHRMYVRVKSRNGWSTYESRRFTLDHAALEGEYFFDTDPGIGQGTAFAMTDSGNGISELSGNLVTPTPMNYGNHLLYIRPAVKGVWGNYDSLGIFVNCSNPQIGNVAVNSVVNNCGEEGVELSLQNSSLNDGTQWSWYEGACGTNMVGTGSTFFVLPDDTTTYYVRGEGGCTNLLTCVTVPVAFDPSSKVDMRMFIEGYYMGNGQMQTALLNEGQPSCANITDTVLFEIRDPFTGNIVDDYTTVLHTNGLARANFQPHQGLFYLVFKHRNGMETWSAAPIELNSEITEFDFSTQSAQAYGDNLAQVEPGIWAIFSGDLNQDRTIDAFDYIILDSDLINGLSGYYSTDLNGDGAIDAFDYILLDTNLLNGITGIYPF